MKKKLEAIFTKSNDFYCPGSTTCFILRLTISDGRVIVEDIGTSRGWWPISGARGVRADRTDTPIDDLPAIPHPEWDLVVAFSQGTSAALLLIHTNRIITKKLILISPFLLDEERYHISLSQNPLHIPTLVIYGETDTLTTPEICQSVIVYSTDIKVFPHKNGHVIPTNGPSKQEMKRFSEKGNEASLPPQRKTKRGNWITYSTEVGTGYRSIDQFLEEHPWICIWGDLSSDRRSTTGIPVDYRKIWLDIPSEEKTEETLHRLAVQWNVLSGKWLVVVPTSEVDAVWDKVARGHVAHKLDSSVIRVSTVEKNRGTQCICIYTSDYRDVKAVERLRGQLTGLLGSVKMNFKPEVYSKVGLYADNEYSRTYHHIRIDPGCSASTFQSQEPQFRLMQPLKRQQRKSYHNESRFLSPWPVVVLCETSPLLGVMIKCTATFSLLDEEGTRLAEEEQAMLYGPRGKQSSMMFPHYRTIPLSLKFSGFLPQRNLSSLVTHPIQ
ncbi:hypothetical protein PROFUN_10600 [Planoprotostelium fungivorum]|uniref:Serine hydrolase domain-containing protein n=1 Tax=Planoprotostelium fungivorum TaxID=1890364 RepID=A0A2P6ND24_9EUKA|nr:hypothetical protein PROFUN_10600 [Planoprotostelium fungivorum]